MRVLVTRPEPDASDEVEALAARGHEGVKSPLLVIEQVEERGARPRRRAGADRHQPERASRALHPSRDLDSGPHACRSSPSARRRRARARELGFAEVIEGPGNGAGLAELIEAEIEPSAGRLVHLAGDTLAFDLKSALAGARLQRDVQPVLYRAVPSDRTYGCRR